MAIVPRQVIADAEVIAYWSKKLRLARDEIAPLLCGINPFAWEEFCKTKNLFVMPERKGRNAPFGANKIQEIKDVLTVIDHRHEEASMSSMTLQEWKIFFLSAGVQLPDWLNNLTSERVRSAIGRMDSPDFCEKVRKALAARNENPLALQKWFLHDSWAWREAILLLIGLDPDGTVIQASETIYGEFREDIELAMMLNGTELPPLSFLEDIGGDALYKMRKYAASWHLLNSLWNSGDHPKRNSPTYYIDWATKKGLEIDWLEWAVEQGFVAPKTQIFVGGEIEKELSTRERNSLLTIIALLADEANIDWRQTSKAAASILFRAEKLGVNIGQRTIEEHLKKIPDALERRMKSSS